MQELGLRRHKTKLDALVRVVVISNSCPNSSNYGKIVILPGVIRLVS